jgi:small conductance mechanosensitive channel
LLFCVASEATNPFDAHPAAAVSVTASSHEGANGARWEWTVFRNRNMNRMFETRSHSWREAGLMRQLDVRAIKRARARGVVLLALFIGIIEFHDHYRSLLGNVNPDFINLATVIAVLILGWALASDLGKVVGPTFFRRVDPSTAGTVGFFMRLAAIAAALLIALGIAGVDTSKLTIGASFAAVIFGLASQQTLGNVIAGMVLLSARPFRVGERVRLQAGGVGGQVEGVVSSLGLLYTAFASGDDLIMVPNGVVLNCAVIPLREPDAVDLRARLRPGVTPGELQRLLEQSLRTQVRGSPRIHLEELDGEEVVVRITATPKIAADGPALATEVLSIVSQETRAAEQRGERDGSRSRTPRDDGSPARPDARRSPASTDRADARRPAETPDGRRPAAAPDPVDEPPAPAPEPRIRRGDGNGTAGSRAREGEETVQPRHPPRPPEP